MEDGVLLWLISNSNSSSTASIRRHIELTLCHLAQNGQSAFLGYALITYIVFK